MAMMDHPEKSLQTNLILKTHSKIGLATKVLILPMEMSKLAEDEVVEFDTLEELVLFMETAIDSSPGLDSDPWYFRLGKM